MKKINLLFIVIALFTTTLKAQSIQNGDFELWSFGKPVGWTQNLYGTITSMINIPVSVDFGEKTTDAHSGSSAIKLQSADFQVPVVDYSINIPGMLQLGESEGFSIPLSDIMNIINALTDTTGNSNIDFDNLSQLTSLAKMLSPGIPCSETPAAIGMWIKYFPDGDDNMVLVAMTKKNGIPVDYSINTFGAYSEYHQVGANFDKKGEECDSLMLIVMSSEKLNSGSVLYVDDVEILDHPLKINNLQTNNIQIYPNPATSVLNLKSDNDEITKYSVFDISGKMLISGSFESSTNINIGNLSNGIYLIKTERNGIVETRKFSKI